MGVEKIHNISASIGDGDDYEYAATKEDIRNLLSKLTNQEDKKNHPISAETNGKVER